MDDESLRDRAELALAVPLARARDRPAGIEARQPICTANWSPGDEFVVHIADPSPALGDSAASWCVGD